jgi:hypothetical protein
MLPAILAPSVLQILSQTSSCLESKMILQMTDVGSWPIV